MPVEIAFDANWKIDGADFERQIEQAQSVGSLQEFREIVTFSTEVAGAMRDAKVRALQQARKKLAAAVTAEFNAMVDKSRMTLGASDELNAWIDQQVKVQV